MALSYIQQRDKFLILFLCSLPQAEELFETTSSEEEAGGTDSVIDVEDLGNIVGHMKKAKVLLLKGV